MNKKDKVGQILFQIKQQSEELLDNESTEEMSAEELVVLATELVTSNPVTTITYSSPVGTVDRDKVSFMIDETYDLPLFEGIDYEEG